MNIKILGKPYRVEEVPSGALNGPLGGADFVRQVISIDAALEDHMALATLLHEVIEVLNYTLALGLDEPVIMALEAGIFDFLVTNKKYLQAIMELSDERE